LRGVFGGVLGDVVGDAALELARAVLAGRDVARLLVLVERRGGAGARGQRESAAGRERAEQGVGGRPPHRPRDASVATLRMAATAKMTAARVRVERASEPAAAGARAHTVRPGAALVGFLVLL